MKNMICNNCGFGYPPHRDGMRGCPKCGEDGYTWELYVNYLKRRADDPNITSERRRQILLKVQRIENPPKPSTRLQKAVTQFRRKLAAMLRAVAFKLDLGWGLDQ